MGVLRVHGPEFIDRGLFKGFAGRIQEFGCWALARRYGNCLGKSWALCRSGGFRNPPEGSRDLERSRCVEPGGSLKSPGNLVCPRESDGGGNLDGNRGFVPSVYSPERGGEKPANSAGQDDGNSFFHGRIL
jgi:hypothetical protein